MASGKRYLLFLDDREMRLFPRRSPDAPPIAFAGDTAGLSAFAAWLREHPGAVFEVICNLADESFRVESLPRLSGRDRRAVLQRQLTRYFGETPHVLACTLGVVATGERPEEQVLFAALHAPLLEKLVETLRLEGASLRGLYSFAMLLGEACRANGETPEALLLLTRHAGTVRETFLRHGKVVFSRLIAASSREMDWLIEEAEQMRRYLAGQRLLARNTPLVVCSFAGSWRLEDGDPEGARLSAPPLSAPFSDLAEVETVLRGWLAGHSPRTQFASVPARRAGFIRTLSNVRWLPWALTACGLVIFGAGLWSGAREWRSARALEQRLSGLRRQIAAFGTMDISSPPMSASGSEPADLQAFFARYDALRQEAGQECLELALPSQALEAQPEMRLEKLVWQCAAGRQTVIVEGRLANVAALEAFEHWLRGWNPPGWRVEMPEEETDAVPPATGAVTISPSGDGADHAAEIPAPESGDSGIPFRLRLARVESRVESMKERP